MVYIGLVWMLGFFAMAGYAFWLNEDWAKDFERMNDSWFELAKRHNEEWDELCGKLLEECKELRGRLEERERNDS